MRARLGSEVRAGDLQITPAARTIPGTSKQRGSFLFCRRYFLHFKLSGGKYATILKVNNITKYSWGYPGQADWLIVRLHCGHIHNVGQLGHWTQILSHSGHDSHQRRHRPRAQHKVCRWRYLQEVHLIGSLVFMFLCRCLWPVPQNSGIL